MKNWFLFLIFSFGISMAQESKFASKIIQITRLTEGTLLIPTAEGKQPLAILIGDSGPMDRNGNQQMMENNHLKFLAEGLYKRGIATFRYDKRIISLMRRGVLREENINFQDFVDDAIAVVNYFKKDDRFSELYIIGHGEGSLIGMIAAQENVDGFVSIAGAGQELDDMIVSQLDREAPGLTENARQAFDDLRATGQANNYSPGLASIFRKEVQPYLYSWMQFDPKEEIAKLDIPVMIINGDKDLQVHISEAEILKKIKPEAIYSVVPNMNHIFKRVDGSYLENRKTYNQYNLPVIPELINSLSEFIKMSSKK